MIFVRCFNGYIGVFIKYSAFSAWPTKPKTFALWSLTQVYSESLQCCSELSLLVSSNSGWVSGYHLCLQQSGLLLCCKNKTKDHKEVCYSKTPNTCPYTHVGITMFIWAWVHGWAGVCTMCVEAHEVDTGGLPTLYFSPVIETNSFSWTWSLFTCGEARGQPRCHPSGSVTPSPFVETGLLTTVKLDTQTKLAGLVGFWDLPVSRAPVLGM